MFSLFSSVSVDRGLKRNLEQREVKGSIILWKRKKWIIGWDFKLNIKIGLVKVERSIKWGGRERSEINTKAKLIEGQKCWQDTSRSVCFGSKFELHLFWVMVMDDKCQEKNK